MADYSRKEAIHLLWHKGIVHWKLDENQKELYNLYKDAKNRINTWLLARRSGKSFALCALAIEKCLEKPNSIVKYVAPQSKMVRTIIKPLMREILSDCPFELKPDFKTQEQLYRFPNGSEIQLAGTDNKNAENIRGGSADLCIVDEAGFCEDLDYIVKSILFPTTTTTGGKIILSSTPPISESHDFTAYIRQAESSGVLVKKTVYDNPRLTKEVIADIVKEYGGADNEAFRREYLCEIIIDATKAVIPEFTEALKLKIVKEWKTPEFFDGYVALDIGGRDLTVLLFAYLDFVAGKLIIDDEFVVKGASATTDIIAANVHRIEEERFNKKAYLRVADNNNILLLNDLQRLHSLTFVPTAKDNSEAALNNVRIMLKQESIVINPRCVTLIRHLQRAIWNSSRTSYIRTQEEGHFDAIDALKYLCRNVQFYKNPFPTGHNLNRTDPYFNISSPSQQKYSKFTAMFSTKKSIKG